MKTGQKSLIYESLNALNQSMEQVLEHLHRLKELGILSANSVENQKILAEEFRAGVNHAIVDKLNSREEEDWAKFGKLRMERDVNKRGVGDIGIRSRRILSSKKRQS